MKEMMNWLSEEESGQGMVEYALIIALISIAAIAIMGTVGNAINDKFTNVSNALGGNTAG